jgi:hypothetical protein
MLTHSIKRAASLVFGLLLAVSALPLAAQPESAMLEMLLRPAGWRAEWTGPGGSGVTELVFQREGEQLIAKIRLIQPFEMTCENPVTVGAGTVSFDGCRDPGLTLLFNPKDEVAPFRGSTPRGYQWTLRAK